MINFDALVDLGMISKSDLNLFIITDSTDDAFRHVPLYLGYGLTERGSTL
jgi:hypothetical protein